MKKLNLLLIGLVLMILVGCGASRIDQKASELSVESLATQVTEVIDDDSSAFEYQFKDEDKFLILTMKQDDEIRIRVKNPDPIKKPIKWGFVKPAKFIGRYKNIKFESSQAEQIQSACKPLFDKRQKELITEELKYHQVD